ncbi:DNA replication/repair protein RecF [Oceanirhabdus seepicola]|uniref:DNA replication and repair protein RecF n=1 Tax=Oceanirhabdus seepicola TaxID=2828781 RepID=A0A9J6P907_9CLOT|nr:DNA replication/repair protein RecF [Oceanirhabdus seepicola]MCM1992361.1 DNA replication/repair protein RecF [Oceanirhabdus seepicola]
MYIEYLKLINYRNYEMLDLKLTKEANIFIGDNAQGKTNILESIYLASLGKSHRTKRDKELIMWNSEAAYIQIYVCKERLNKKIDMKIFKHGAKGLNINSIKVNKLSELIGALNVVMFSPEDLKIVKESPVYRRKFLDIELCKLSKAYLHNLTQYKKALGERNAALKKINNKELLDIYDMTLASFGIKIIKDRIEYIKNLNLYGKKMHKDITQNREVIEFRYISPLNEITEEELYKLFVKNRERDMFNKSTNVGPHRDDFEIIINEMDTRIYGSQGQQRTAVLTIKFASLKVIKHITGEYPVLLLDDVLSELDSNRQRYILNSIKDVQTFITCTGISDIREHISGETKVFLVNKGHIDEIT